MRNRLLMAALFIFSASMSYAQYGAWLPATEYSYREFDIDPLIHVSAQIQKKVAYKGKTVAWRVINKSPDPINIDISVQYIFTCDGSEKVNIINAKPIEPGPDYAIKYYPGATDPKKLGKGFFKQLDYCLDDTELKDIVILEHTVTTVRAPKTEEPIIPPVVPSIEPPTIPGEKEADRDKDLIPDKTDWCPDDFGLMQFHGCPPPDRPLQVLNVVVVKSITGNIKLTPVTFSEGNYEEYIEANGKVTEPEASAVSQYGLSLSFNRFFGNKRIIGAQLGVQYDNINFKVTRNEFLIEFKSQDAGGYSYRRRIRANEPITEKITMQQLRIPIEVIFSNRLTDNINFFVGAGPMISLTMGGSSDVKANFDYEAIYSPDAANPNNKDAFSAEDHDTDWLITEDFVNQHANATTGTNDYFTDHQDAGYDVKNNEPVDKEVKFTFKPSIGITAEAGIDYKVSDNNLLRIGIQWISTSYKSDNPESYQLTDKIGEFDSMLNGLDKMSTSFISVKLGLVFGLNK